MKVVIVIESGMVREVLCDAAALEYAIVDRDSEGSLPGDCPRIEGVEAYVSVNQATSNAARVGRMLRAVNRFLSKQ